LKKIYFQFHTPIWSKNTGIRIKRCCKVGYALANSETDDYCTIRQANTIANFSIDVKNVSIYGNTNCIFELDNKKQNYTFEFENNCISDAG
jgi:hypothetical protein